MFGGSSGANPFTCWRRPAPVHWTPTLASLPDAPRAFSIKGFAPLRSSSSATDSCLCAMASWKALPPSGRRLTWCMLAPWRSNCRGAGARHVRNQAAATTAGSEQRGTQGRVVPVLHTGRRHAERRGSAACCHLRLALLGRLLCSSDSRCCGLPRTTAGAGGGGGMSGVHSCGGSGRRCHRHPGHWPSERVTLH